MPSSEQRAYQVCFECGQVYATAAQLLAAHNELMAGLGFREWTDARSVWSCPECAHDFFHPPGQTTLVRRFATARPEIVCLCGSTRFFDTFREWNLRLTIAGLIVLSIGCDTESDGDLFGIADTTAVTSRLDELHKRKIDLCDWVFVLDVDGYIGESTRCEIDYATRIGRPVRYLSAESGWAAGQVDLWQTSNPHRRIDLDPAARASHTAVGRPADESREPVSGSVVGDRAWYVGAYVIAAQDGEVTLAWGEGPTGRVLADRSGPRDLHRRTGRLRRRAGSPCRVLCGR